jgi:hypothetical protein
MSVPNQIDQSSFGLPLVNFQLDNLSIREKSQFSFGKQLAEDIMSKVNGGLSSYFMVRNQRWKVSRNYANGRIPMQRFMDLLEFNGKQNYINLNWQCIHIVNRIVSGLVGRWMAKSEKISVTATDSLSIKNKQDGYEQLEFIIDNRRKLEELQAASGVQMIPNEGVPEDKDELRLWQAQFQRLPEEILYELGINDVLGANGFFDVLKEKMLHDSTITGFVSTYTWMDSEGVVHVEWLKPENCFYSYSNYPDFRDTSWRGYMRTLKISELRKRYSREFHPNNPNALDEEQIFQMARTAKEFQLYDNITWNTEWNVIFLRPYDEWNVDVLEFELKTVDTETWTSEKTKKNGTTIIKKGKPNRPLKDNEQTIDDSKINIYRGVYARSTQTMLEWGLKKNMIRPQDPKEMGNAEFSYSFFMVQNYDMMCLGVPEKIQEPADQMIIARLKMQQLVAKMRPVGAAVNWDALQNIDYGLGEGNKTIDVKKLFDQSGDLYYRGKDAEGNPIPVPIIELQNAGFLNQLQGLILLYDKHYQIMKDELGEDPNLISQALQPRVAAGNVQASQETASYATDQYYRAYINCLADTAKKVSCLLKDSVTYGAKVYRNIISEQDIEGRIFSTKIQMLPDAYDIQKFEALMQQSIQANPELLQFLNPFQLMRVAKEDVKLSETLFRQAQKKLIQYQQQTAQQNQQATIDGQIKSAQAAEDAKRQSLAMELDIKKQISDSETNNKIKQEIVTGIFSIYSKGLPIPQELKGLETEIIRNVGLPLFAENLANAQAMAQGMQGDEQEQHGQPEEQPEEMQQQNINQQPPQVAA